MTTKSCMIMILTDYHNINNNFHEKYQNDLINSVIRVNVQNLNLTNNIELVIFCIENKKTKVKKLIEKIFDGETKYSLFVIPKILPKKYLFPFMNKLFGNFYETDESNHYLQFIHTIKRSKNVLFITDLDNWFNIAKKNKKLLQTIYKLPNFWDVIDFTQETETYNNKINFTKIMKKTQMLVEKDDIDWSSGVLLHSNSILLFKKNILKKDFRFQNIFTIYQDVKLNYNLLNFNFNHYCNLNFDLRNMDIRSATSHFIQHGWLKEHRHFRYPPLSDIPEPSFVNTNKSTIVLLNHSETLTGAPYVIHNLFNELMNDDRINVYLFTPKVNSDLFRKINIKPDFCSNIIQFYHNPLFIKKCLNKINPKCIVVNSFSSEFVCLEKTFNKYNTVLYVHETYEHYIPNQINLSIDCKLLLCADHYTLNSFQKKKFNSKTNLLPPKFVSGYFEDIKKNIKPIFSLVEVNQFLKWTSKPLIGMVGTPCERKNYELFMSLSKFLPNYEFVWIGGHESLQLKNLTIIPQTSDVLSYMYLFNCFFLTSQIDLCPIVLLEALSLNIPSLIFKDNIGFEHNKCKHLNIINGNINQFKMDELKKFIDDTIKFPELVENKLSPNGNNYIKQNFIYADGEFVQLLEKQIDFKI